MVSASAGGGASDTAGGVGGGGLFTRVHSTCQFKLKIISDTHACPWDFGRMHDFCGVKVGVGNEGYGQTYVVGFPTLAH